MRAPLVPLGAFSAFSVQGMPMDRNSMQKLRLDRRLVSRRDWISPAEFERELEALPDASHKATTLGEAGSAGKKGAESGRVEESPPAE